MYCSHQSKLQLQSGTKYNSGNHSNYEVRTTPDGNSIVSDQTSPLTHNANSFVRTNTQPIIPDSGVGIGESMHINGNMDPGPSYSVQLLYHSLSYIESQLSLG